MRRVVFNNEDEENEYREDAAAKKKPRAASLIKKRRERVSEQCPLRGYLFYQYLSERSNNHKWRYLCMLSHPSFNPSLYASAAQSWASWGGSGLPAFSHGFDPAKNDGECEEARMLRDLGVGKMYFSKPWFALIEPSSVTTARLVLGEKLVFVYDIYKNKVLLDFVKPEK